MESKHTALTKHLRIKSDMINMGERIQWGSETAIMDEAATTIEHLEAALIKAQSALQSARDGGSFKHPQIGQSIDDALTHINSVLGE
jgi:hypothetical protein